MAVVDDGKVASDSNSDTDGDMPKLEDVESKDDENHDGEAEGTARSSGIRTKQSRNEKKARALLSKLNFKLVPGVASVKLKRNKQMSFIITKPEVFKCANSDRYVIFGDVKGDDYSGQNRSDVSGRFPHKMDTAAGGVVGMDVTKGLLDPNYAADSSSQNVAYVEEEEEGDNSADYAGVNEKDIELVIQQTSCTRAKAISVLKKTKNDIVEAIMQLSS